MARRAVRCASPTGCWTRWGSGGFAEQARRELLAIGETVRKPIVQVVGTRSSHVSEPLTAQEAEIARLARDGLSNPEIGARLFISERTVQYHLGKVFTKLDIGSRSQLRRVLPSDPVAVKPR
jgi:DNA-binding CsgD family transcriptional regulator